MARLELQLLKTTLECHDGDVLGRCGSLGRELVAELPQIADRHLLIGRQDGAWFVMIPRNVATPTTADGRPVAHGVRLPLYGTVQICLGDLPLRFVVVEKDAARSAVAPAPRAGREALPPVAHAGEAALPFDSSLLQTVVNAVGDLIAVIDPQGRRIWNNDAYARVLGYQPEELRGTYSLAEVHPNDQPLLKEVAAESMRTGIGRRIEYQMRHKNGSWISLESASAVIPDARSRERLLVIIARDITARRQTEAENRERNRRQIEQLAALSAFATSREFHAGDLERCFAMATESLAKATACDRAGIWLFDAARASLECADLFTRSLAEHSTAPGLRSSECPQYFAALGLERVISADQAFDSALLRDLRSGYLVENQIVSKLDAPILRGDELIGVLTCESTAPRQWTIDEQGFVTSLADLILLAITTCDRLRTFQALKESQKLLAAELADAASYVRSLLPPYLTGVISTDWRFLPSAQLGGDAFGYRWIDDRHFAFYLLDTVGHGVRAALLSVMAINFLRGETQPHLDWLNPSEVLGTLNQAFQMKEPEEMYFTIWYGVLDSGSRTIRYAAAGHPPAILYAGATEETVVPIELRGREMMIGAAPDTRYTTHTQALDAFSELYLFSDGVYEITRPDGATGTLRDFVKLLRRPLRPGLSELDSLIQQVRENSGQPDLPDDLSLVKFGFHLIGDAPNH